VDAVSFLVCSGLPLHVYSLAFVVALLGLFPLRFGRLVLPANSAVCFSAEVSCPAFLLALVSSCLHTSAAKFSLYQIVLPAHLCGCRLFWVGLRLLWRLGLCAFVSAASACKLGLVVPVLALGLLFGLFRNACCLVGKLFVSVVAFQVLWPCCLLAVSCLFRLLCFGSGRKVRFSLGLALITHQGKSSYFGLWLFGFGSARWPNKSVKGTRRPLAVLKFIFYQGSVASFRFR